MPQIERLFSLEISNREIRFRPFQEIYRCEIDLANFAGNLSRIQGEVNAWIAEKTDHKIPELFTDHDMYPKDVLWLLNGTYFRGFYRETRRKADNAHENCVSRPQMLVFPLHRMISRTMEDAASSELVAFSVHTTEQKGRLETLHGRRSNVPVPRN